VKAGRVRVASWRMRAAMSSAIGIGVILGLIEEIGSESALRCVFSGDRRYRA
jgi:hypothetical protein